MYLEHFGLSEPPFRITPVTVFFFSGANRGEILDALIYSISEVEGIIKVSGEVGSGKTMLCRMLLEKLPPHIEAIYLANPSLTREEMLYAIADGLGLNIKDERVGIIMQNIQNKLEEKAREGKRVVVLVDEAHAMPLVTLEELRLLYNLQVGNAKLMQIVLFGQPELNTKLDQPNMRQLKDRIAHHFNMQPLSRNILENYLMFRMRAAGYHGPDIFSADAVKLIAEASNGLMRRVNILADKSLLAAFVEDTHSIEIRHVRAAMRDSELNPTRSPSKNKVLAVAVLAASVLAGLWGWLLMTDANKPSTSASSPVVSESITPPIQTPPAQPYTLAATDISLDDIPPETADKINPEPSQPEANSENTSSSNTEVDSPAIAPAKPEKTVTAEIPALYAQRITAGKELIEKKKAVASLQLFYNEKVRPERIEGFLKRAEKLGVLSEIYLLPAKFGNKDGLRVLYGAYPSVDEARSASNSLPTRYKNSFAASIYIF